MGVSSNGRKFPQLSPRLQEVAFLCADGLSYKQIGQVLGLKPKTIDAYAQQIGQRIPGSGSLRFRIRQLVRDTTKEPVALGHTGACRLIQDALLRCTTVRGSLVRGVITSPADPHALQIEFATGEHFTLLVQGNSHY